MILADTGFFVALANRRDRYHAVAVEALRSAREPLVTSLPVMTETCHLLLARLGEQAAVTFVENGARGAFTIHPITEDDLPRIAELMRHYRGLPMDLADASLVILAEHLGSGRIFSTDQRDFRTYRWKRRKPFQNLLPDPA